MDATESVEITCEPGDINEMNRSSYNIQKSGKKSDGISVILRVRPLTAHEISKKDISGVEFPGNGQIKINSHNCNKSFSFNVCFEPDADQRNVFDHSGIKRLTELSCEGYQCTCFVYGQTGSGKTFTMTGPPQEFLLKTHPDPSLYGITPQCFYYLFDILKSRHNYRIYANYLEIYNEQVKDLLNPSPLYPLNIRWRKRRGFYVDNLFLIECDSGDDLLEVLQRGMKNRTFHATNPNEFSSRSHCIFSIMIDAEITDPNDETVTFTKHGKLTFVDLAGSEKIKTGPEITSSQLQETNNINRSLLVLGNCISSLSDPKRKNTHIPFRDSKLTKLLADSLGGNGVNLMIACVSPSLSSATDTANTLRYATRALKIESHPSMKLDPREKTIANLKKEIFFLRQENLILKSRMISNFRNSSPNVKRESKELSEFSSKLTVREESQLMVIDSSKTQVSLNSNQFPSDQQETNLNLYEMLQEYMIENENLRGKNMDAIQEQEKMSRELEQVMKENEKLMENIEKLCGTNNGSNGNDISESNKVGTALSDQKSTSKFQNPKNSERKRFYSRDPINIDLSDESKIDSSYVKIFDSKKKNFTSLSSRRSFTDGTKLIPIKRTSNEDFEIYKKVLNEDILKIENQINMMKETFYSKNKNVIR